MKSCRQSYDNAYSNVYKHGHSGQRQHVAQVASGHPAQTTQLTAVTAAQVTYSSVAETMTKNITFSKHLWEHTGDVTSRLLVILNEVCQTKIQKSTL